MPAPVNAIAMFEDGTSNTLHQTPAIWMNDPKQTIININTKKKIKSLMLDGGIYMDADESNYKWQSDTKSDK